MAVIDDLLQKVNDPILRDRLAKEIHKATKHKKFGLVFEEHLPECTPLYDVPIKKGSRVAVRDTEIKETFTVLSVEDGTVKCVSNNDKALHEFPLNDLVTVAEFGEPIYPYLQTIDTVCNAPDSDLWHTLIEADNYHALQLLEYMYAGEVDCIYIDPPYNKEDSKDWKYNCNYVDGNDMYRHSKWLSMMERRLKLAKKLLNPKSGVMIVTIDEKEYLHLGMLLEQMLPEAYIQMVTIVNNPKGSTRGRFSRVDEYAFFCFMPEAYVSGSEDAMLGEETTNESGGKPRWKGLLRSGMGARREDSPNLYYPILIDEKNGRIVKAGNALPLSENPIIGEKIEGYTAAWPVRDDGSQGRWMLATDTFNEMLAKGYIALGGYDGRRQTWGFSYLSKKYQQQIETGELVIVGRSENGQTVDVVFKDVQERKVKTVWHRTRHDAGAYGSDLVSNVIGRSRAFTYPKSLYAVEDCIAMVVKDKPTALIVDFFAGSGTTLHAVNLLNSRDAGHRRCILVTNNEIGDKQEDKMRQDGYRPGDPEWEAIGIARYATWPRTVCSIEGHDVNGKPLKGTYLGTDTKMSDGFKANAIYFKLGFLDKNAVALGRQFKELLGVLWMKAGAIGPCPHLAKNATIPEMMILPENKMAILIDDTAFASFSEQVKQHPEIETVYIVTDSDRGYREMSRELDIEHTYQLYRNYLDNFRINHRR